MRILQVRQIYGESSAEDRVWDLSGSGVLPLDAFKDGTTLLGILCSVLYGRDEPRSGAPRSDGSSLAREREEGHECRAEVVFQAGGAGAPSARYRASCLLREDGGGIETGQRALQRLEDGAERDVCESVEDVTGLSFEAFLRSALLRQGAFSDLLRTDPEAREPAWDALLGDGLRACAASLAYGKYRAEQEERLVRGAGSIPLAAGEAEERRRELSEVLRTLRALEDEGERGESEARYGDSLAQTERELRDLEQRKADWEKEMALFAPDRRRLDQARLALELGEAHRALSALRRDQERDRLEQMGLNADLSRYRDETQTAEEAFSLAEGVLRDRLVQQKKLADTLRTVRDLDRQAQDRQDAAQEARGQLQSLEAELTGVSAKAEREQAALEKIGISLRDARKYLQTNPADEKLSSALEGIHKCFDLFSRAQENRRALKESYEKALRRRQGAQNALNDRQAMFSDISHRFGIVEKNFERAQAFFGGSLKGKPLEEWREICSFNERRLQDMERLGEALHREREVQDEMRHLLDRRLKMEGEKRELGMKEAEQAARIERAEEALRQLERRVELMRRVDALGDDVRQLLQEAAPCPLCGSPTHPYTGGVLPDSGEVQRQLLDADRELRTMREEFAARQATVGRLEEETFSIGRTEEELRRELAALNGSITEEVAALGLKFGVGVSPLEELARVRQSAREQMQRARDVLSAAEQAERELLAAKDELERIRGSQEELTRFHQEALSGLKQSQDEVERLEKEIRSHEESFNSVRRELIGQLSLFGYKNLPDENPRQLLTLMEARSVAWIRRTEEKEGLERALCAAQASLQALRKEQESLKAEAASRTDRAKHLEAERDALQQQRVVLFAAKDPQTEEARMETSVEEARRQLELRREVRNENRDRLEKAMVRLHDLETAQATRRDRVQKEEIAFGKSLLAKGFRNEDDYLSACLSEEERRALQERLRELSRSGLEIGISQDDVRFAQEELRSLSHPRPKASAALPNLLERAGTLYLELGSDAEGERLYRAYGDALRRRGFEGSELLKDPVLGDCVRGLAFEAVLRRANSRLERGGFPLRLFRERRSLGVLMKDERRPDRLLSADGGSNGTLSGGLNGGSEDERRTASLALAWGLCDLFLWAEGGANLRVWDGLPNGGEAAAALADALCGEGERVCLRN